MPRYVVIYLERTLCSTEGICQYKLSIVTHVKDQLLNATVGRGYSASR